MNYKRHILTLIFSLMCILNVYSQNFSNSDLDGPSYVSGLLPSGWQNVSAVDPVCIADNPGASDTPDLTSATGPSLIEGIVGIPHSGSAFVCGNKGEVDIGFSISIFDEGIQQTVNGLSIGLNYTINFYQAVVKQSNAIDTSGSWSVYKDSELLGISTPTQSSLAFDDINLIWESRSITFVATETSHTFKFLPTDDDPDPQFSFTNEQGGLRMGIDLITLDYDCTLDLGPDLSLCEQDLPFEISSTLNGTYSWNTGENTQTIEVSDSGLYILEVLTDCGLRTDSIQINLIENILPVNLGDDIEICSQNFPITLTTDVLGDYLWSTFESTQSIIVNQPGIYTISVSNACNTVADDISIIELDANSTLDLGEDLVACLDDFPIILDAGVHDTYLWNNGQDTQAVSISESGEYGVTVTNSCGTASDQLIITLLQPPSDIFLGEDFASCENLFPLILEIEDTINDIDWSNGSSEQQISIIESGSYDVTVSNQCGTSYSSINISSNSNPIEQETFTLCQGESISFLGENFSEEGYYQLVESVESPVACDIFWDVYINLIPTDTLNVFLQYNVGGEAIYDHYSFDESGVYYIYEIDEIGCDLVVKIHVEEEPELFVYVPSSFTPNEDGLNEFFRPVITLVGDMKMNYFEFEIYDRYGQVIYENDDHTAVGWNGSGSEGSNYYVQDGVYNWVLRYGTNKNAERKIENGSVSIVR